MVSELRKTLVSRYFKEGYPYKTILQFLRSLHGIRISMRTLKLLLQQLNLRRRMRRNSYQQTRHIRRVNKLKKVMIWHGCCLYILHALSLCACIQRELAGSGKLIGYRRMWQRIRQTYNEPVARKCAYSVYLI